VGISHIPPDAAVNRRFSVPSCLIFESSGEAGMPSLAASTISRSRSSQAFSMAAPLAVLSNTHHTSSAVEIPRTVAASVAMAFSSYRDQYVRGDPCSRKYATRGEPAGAVASGTGAGSAATREIPYRSNSAAAAGENHVACLGSQTTGPL
jgi:hypothetical protein